MISFSSYSCRSLVSHFEIEGFFSITFLSSLDALGLILALLKTSIFDSIRSSSSRSFTDNFCCFVISGRVYRLSTSIYVGRAMMLPKESTFFIYAYPSSTYESFPS